jgi:hypothetical protein
MALYEHSVYTRAGHVLTCAFMFQAGISFLKLALFIAAVFGLDAVVLPMYRPRTRGNYTLAGFDAVRPRRYDSPVYPLYTPYIPPMYPLCSRHVIPHVANPRFKG